MIDRKYLPSKKFLVALALAIMVILIAIVFNYSRSNKVNKNENIALDANATSSIVGFLNNIDTDHDVLPDWQEVLYGTDPKNSDTDKDGTPDGEEIKLNRDPLKANTAPKGQESNDKIDPELIANEQKITEEYQNLNPIEKMARNLMSNIIANQPANSQMDQGTIDNIVQKSIEDLPQKQFLGTTKESDLNFQNVSGISTSTWVGYLITYSSDYYRITESLRKIIGQDLTILNYDISNGQDLEKEKIIKIISYYQIAINNLIKMPLPAVSSSSITFLHLNIINDLEKLISVDNDIISNYKDALTVYADFQFYSETLEHLLSAFKIMDALFQINRN